MKKISLPASAPQALINTGECEVRKPVAKSPVAMLPALFTEYRHKVDRYGLEDITEPEFGFTHSGRFFIFPWGGPGEYVQVKDSRRRCEIMDVEVVAGRKKYNWLIKLRLV